MRSIGLVGRRRVGKDTAAAHLINHHGYLRVAFADPLKAAALDLDPIVSITPAAEGAGVPVRLAEMVTRVGWERAKDTPEVRRVLQCLGTGLRHAVGEHVWRDVALAAITEAERAGRPVVVTDVRYPDEAAALRARGLLLVRLRRPALRPAAAEDEHESERGTDTIPVDRELINAGTPAELAAALTTMVAG